MSKFFVGNLPFGADETDLKEFFESQGVPVQTVDIITDRETGKSRGFGFVEVQNEYGQAGLNLDGGDLQGRSLNISQARERERTARGERRARN